ncbi:MULTISPECIES: hemerythrin domain-containing protein [unclassified Streptomyces]|uniref:hemerythrin domain-containing protein n=1 Tax=unclassified Streptomyces TaxID=2593676 RepID=UPI001661B518|nr:MULTISPECIES: hemerythrin domain-containing protein [unclassified Streptomyces]MBD0839572.1 hemerythrin domain-containing protein [Streptomyces sp. TRM68416]
MADETDALTELAEDQRQLADIFRRIEHAEARDEGLRHHTDQATIELVRHYVSEEEFLYPALTEHPGPARHLVDHARDRLVEGADLVKSATEDHARAERLMRDLASADVESAEFADLVQRLLRMFRTQTRDERDLLFPYTREVLPEPVLVDLGFRMRRVKSIVPTRPYPTAPGVPPTGRLLFPGPGLVDRVRAVLSGWSHTF